MLAAEVAGHLYQSHYHMLMGLRKLQPLMVLAHLLPRSFLAIGSQKTVHSGQNEQSLDEGTLSHHHPDGFLQGTGDLHHRKNKRFALFIFV